MTFLKSVLREHQGTVSRIRFFFQFHPPRRTHVFCIGTAKSGTNSIGNIFFKNLRSLHEANSKKIISLIFNIHKEEINTDEINRLLLRRDSKLHLDIDSSQLNFYLIDYLLKLFPDAKYVLTIRHPYQWLDSIINHQLSRRTSRKWKQFRVFRFQPEGYDYPPEEQILKEKGLFTLDGYLAYWAFHNQTTLEKIPKEKLLILRTDQINDRLQDFLAFANISLPIPDTLNAHYNKAVNKHGILEKIDKTYLNDKIQSHCKPLIDTFFPDYLDSNA